MSELYPSISTRIMRLSRMSFFIVIFFEDLLWNMVWSEEDIRPYRMVLMQRIS